MSRLPSPIEVSSILSLEAPSPLGEGKDELSSFSTFKWGEGSLYTKQQTNF